MQKKKHKEPLVEKALDYWFTVEFLGQGKYPDIREVQNSIRALKNDVRNHKARKKAVWDFVELKKGDSISHIVSSEARACGMKLWGNLTIYVGKVKREACIECIARRFPAEAGTRPEKSGDKIAWASLQLSPEGRYLPHSLALSTIIWSLNQVREGREKIAHSLDLQQYQEEVEGLESFFVKGGSKDTCPGDGTDGEKMALGLGMPSFGVDSVTAGDLEAFYRVVKDKYLKGNISFTAEADNVEEVYGIAFQLFKDEEARLKNQDDGFPGLGQDFYSADIKLLLEKAREGELLGDLAAYICAPSLDWEERDGHRIGLVDPKGQGEAAYLAQLGEILSVKNAPLGKWPSRFMPALMQQIAINLAIGKGKGGLFGKNGKIFSVNGPPGTGKTTLLKEIVVNNIVERAILLSGYEEPDKAFEKHSFRHGSREGNAYSKYVRYWYTLKDEKINDYSILVTSCNNAAVENISKELPMGTGILKDLAALGGDGQEVKEALGEGRAFFDVKCSQAVEQAKGESYQDIYFTRYAAGLLENENAWGLIAAPLGKQSNIVNFYNKVLGPLRWDFYPNGEAAKNRLEKYREVKESFLAQLALVKGMQEEMEGLCALGREKGRALKIAAQAREEKGREIESCQKEIQALKAQIEGWQEERGVREQRINVAKLKEAAIEQELRLLEGLCREKDEEIKEIRRREKEERNSVGALAKLFGSSKYKDALGRAEKYKEEAENKELYLASLEAPLSDCKQRHWEMENQRARVLQEISGIETRICHLTGQLADWERRALGLEGDIQKAHRQAEEVSVQYQRMASRFTKGEQPDSGIPLDEAFTADLLSHDKNISTKAQVSNPWFTQRYNREREKLFYFAMRLNKEFVLSSNRCRDNFTTLAHYWGLKEGDEKERIIFHKEDAQACAGALFQTLFLLVPVLSTTFASVGRLLKDVGQEGVVGTLVVDEAGQAQPQMALGALYRSRKAVIVGDPRQVEPVVTEDMKILRKVFREEALKPYQSSLLSVQGLADQLNGFGTYLDNGTSQPDWVGCPLLVHRRCLSPMYDISNEISYNNMMKQQTRKPDEKAEGRFIYGKSQWINVKGREKGNKNHFVEAQGQKVCELLEIAFQKSDNPSLYIISPFTSVVTGIRAYIHSYCAKNVDSPIKAGLGEWLAKNIGTVHTFQGKEAGEVIFLLGCDGGREAMGAVRWVNSNIVNVAATRAKYRLYVIGDEEVWKNSDCVSTAKRIMDTFALREIQSILKEGLPEDKEREALAAASKALPSVTSFSVEEKETEEGERDYSVDTASLLGSLHRDFAKNPLTREQLGKFGFRSMEELGKLPAGIRENLLLGMKLYYLLWPVYKVNDRLDASCCAILFCKAIELRMKECFLPGLKAAFSDYPIKGNGPGRGRVLLKDARDEELTLGTFDFILRAKGAELGHRMVEKGEAVYNEAWWRSFEKKLKDCVMRRNRCCHSGLFSWKEQSHLLFDLFMEDGPGGREGRTPPMGGIMFESQAGRRI